MASGQSFVVFEKDNVRRLRLLQGTAIAAPHAQPVALREPVPVSRAIAGISFGVLIAGLAAALAFRRCFRGHVLTPMSDKTRFTFSG